MNQTTINITARQDLAQVSLRKKVGKMVQGVNKWLDAKSGFYSRIWAHPIYLGESFLIL